MLQATPAMWHMLLEAGWSDQSPSLVALCGGEALSPKLAMQLLPQVTELWNMYGPTEATIWCAIKKIDNAQSITIGKPIDNIIMLVLDAELSLTHADLDFAYLVEKGIADKPSHIFNFHHDYKITVDNESVAWQEISSIHAKFPMIFQIRCITAEEIFTCVIDYAQDCYDASFVQKIAKLYQCILAILPLQYKNKLSELSLSQSTLLEEIHYVNRIYPNLMTALKNKSEQFPDHIAIRFDNNSISYQNLWKLVESSANKILKYYGKNLKNQAIGVKMPNKAQYIITILAILSLEAIFVPIDDSLPLHRQHQLLADSKAVLCVSTDKITKLMDASPIMPASKNVAYIIYTSGTTGTPKGVPITQKQLASFIDTLQHKFEINANDCILQFAAISFDASIWEIFLSLYAGATLCIPTVRERHVGARLQLFIEKQAITHMILTPSVLQTLDPSSLPTLRHVVSGGESCSRALVAQWVPFVKFFNAYGPTEATICTHICHMSLETKASIIGEPLGNASMLIVSKDFQPLPMGAVGELLIAGDNITQGYLNLPVLNQKHFINLFNKRWYRTGDLMRVLSNHQFEYLGRIDRQIKLRGLRIELGEIESVLQNIAGIKQSVCQIREDLLIAYVVADINIDTQKTMAVLSQYLPGYMLPHRFCK